MKISSKRDRRNGTAVSEAAIILPFILLIISATIEISSAMYLKETLTVCAYEGARVAVQRKSDNKDVRLRIKKVMDYRGVSLGEKKIYELVDVTPDADDADKFDPITVTVRAPTAENMVLPFSWLKLFSVNELSAEVTMIKEFTIETTE